MTPTRLPPQPNEDLWMTHAVRRLLQSLHIPSWAYWFILVLLPYGLVREMLADNRALYARGVELEAEVARLKRDLSMALHEIHALNIQLNLARDELASQMMSKLPHICVDHFDLDQSRVDGCGMRYVDVRVDFDTMCYRHLQAPTARMPERTMSQARLLVDRIAHEVAQRQISKLRDGIGKMIRLRLNIPEAA